MHAVWMRWDRVWFGCASGRVKQGVVARYRLCERGCSHREAEGGGQRVGGRGGGRGGQRVGGRGRQVEDSPLRAFAFATLRAFACTPSPRGAPSRCAAAEGSPPRSARWAASRGCLSGQGLCARRCAAGGWAVRLLWRVPWRVPESIRCLACRGVLASERGFVAGGSSQRGRWLSTRARADAPSSRPRACLISLACRQLLDNYTRHIILLYYSGHRRSSLRSSPRCHTSDPSCWCR